MGIYKVKENGIIRDMTLEEIANLTAQEAKTEDLKPMPSDAERISVIEEALTALLEGATE